MADKIFLRGGSWYRASAKQLPDDIDMGEIIANPSVQYPEIEADGGGGSQTLQEVLTEGSVLTGDNTIDCGGNFLDIFNMIWGEFYANEDTRTAGLYIDAEEGSVVTQLFASDGVGNSSQIELTPTTATLRTGVGTAKNIATILVADDFADDAAAATGGIPVGQLYHTAGAVKVRLV